MEVEESHNPLLSKSKTSDSRLQVQLHPLVLLNVSDYITRYSLRKQTGPIVGAILGSQNGRDITMEHAFECKVDQGNTPEESLINAEWFHDRLQQYKDVHKAAALDFVGWFTLAPPSGPQSQHLPIHHQLLHTYNESALLLTFHPASVHTGTLKGGKLPLAIYETVYEAATDDNDKHMLSSGETAPPLSLRFQELPYTVETGEAEMIGVNFVASGGANASGGNTSSIAKPGAPTLKSTDKGKGKAATSSQAQSQINGNLTSPSKAISAENEELIASLTAKANAIKMLQQRINLIKSYLTSLPPSYLNTPFSADSPPAQMSSDPQISYPILRQISSLLARLPLLTTSGTVPTATLRTNGVAQPPPKPTAAISPHQLEQQTQQTDTQLITLLSTLGSTLQSASSLGKKFSVFETSRNLNMPQAQRQMMDKMRDQPGQMSFGFDQQQGSFGEAGHSRGSALGRGDNGNLAAKGATGMPLDIANYEADDQFGEEGGFGEDNDGDELLQQEEWEEMDERA